MPLMGPNLRKFALTVHVVVTVGWLGSVAAFLALALTGVLAGATEEARGAYIAMGLVTSYVIVPLAIASLVTGILQSIGTPWGLFGHYWVVVKLGITLVSTLLLLVHTHPIAILAELAAQPGHAYGDHPNLQRQMVVDATLALIALIATTALSIYKPRGLTPYGVRKAQREN
ncbi:MAG TPA: hypothetical protein VNZ52_07680 [Candidatus Thermoplasmatota archaeon]|nr:hypothetical protein [Candidatus Thermoplasmatota archaeon]